MQTATLIFLLLTWGVNKSPGLLRMSLLGHVWNPIPVEDDVGSRLILTPYIEAGNIQEARTLSAVNNEVFSVSSFSGYFTVNKKYNSNLFFWFFPAENDYKNAPVILWLEGGPGTTGLLALFNQFGPFHLTENLTLVDNPFTWCKNHSVIFIDNPVGTGFSFTDNEEGYATNQTQIGDELYSAMIQFLTMFPELQQLPFYLAGESYGGKYVPGLGYTVYEHNPTADIKINLQGIAVGNGYTDPINMLDYSEFLYELGLVDTNTREEMKKLEDQCKNLIQENKPMEAYVVWDEIMSLFMQRSNYMSYYHVLYANELLHGLTDYYITFVQQSDIRKAIHVGNTEFSNGTVVFTHLTRDFMTSVRTWLEVLIDNYKVLYYSGQLDIIVAYPLSVNMYNKLQFRAAEEYRNATRVPWYVDGQLAGYMKSAGGFTEVMIRNAGHGAILDKPAWALDLINRFTNNTTFP